ncbi:MAG: nicotinate-nucleotide--dimethylbenzimidazole phosphoribosyltransferase [Selenomonadaceae bacterium]|nr:nicotinate-nucleotide--dimethylbenzimidazole phosphoribosyltransferase [Selenomonadaceae bacterium]
MDLMAVTDQYAELETVKKCTIICCADHGVAAENVSAYPQETTAQMVRNYLVSRGAAANVFSKFARSELLVVDVGIAADMSDLPELVNRKIADGTNNIAKGPAMTYEQADRAINIGIELVETAVEGGYNCFLPGEMGIGNTTASAAVAAVLLRVDPERVTGRGTNISDERFAHKLETVRQAIKVNRIKTKKARDPIAVLAKVGGFELGCMAGIILGAYRHDALVILDGFNTAVAALIACQIDWDCRDCLIASHVGREIGHKAVLDALELDPMLKLDLALGEAIGSSILSRVLDRFTFNESVDAEDDVAPPPPDDVEIEGEFDGDDDGFDMEFSIFDGTGMDVRFNADRTDGFSIEVKKMSDENIAVTDRTFNFYLNTMPVLDRGAMERSRNRLDNLSKPCRSLGVLEEIVMQIAGISGEDVPNVYLGRNIMCLTDKEFDAEEFDENFENGDWNGELNPLTALSDTIEDFDVPLTIAVLSDGSDPTAAFDFGRAAAEDISFKTPIIGLTVLNDVAAYEDLGEDLSEALLTSDGSLKYGADEFLKHVPKESRSLVSAVIGALVAATHNSSLVIVDMGAVDLIARYVEELCPGVRPYILHASKLMVPSADGIEDALDGEAICIALEVVQAALNAAVEMKTFAETGVRTAIDGIGNFRQLD